MRSGWERHVIVLACPGTCHIKNTPVACHISTLYGVLSQLFLIQSISTSTFIYFSSFIYLLSLFHSAVTYWTNLHTVKIIVCTMLCKCFYMQQEIQEMLRLCILILWHHFFLNLCSKLSSVILLNYKKSNWFCFLHKSSLGSPQTKQWVDWRKYT